MPSLPGSHEPGPMFFLHILILLQSLVLRFTTAKLKWMVESGTSYVTSDKLPNLSALVFHLSSGDANNNTNNIIGLLQHGLNEVIELMDFTGAQ